MDKYLKKIKAIINEKTGMDPEEIEQTSFFEDDLNISQLELEEIYSALEDEYKIELEDEEKEQLESVTDLIDLIVEKVE